MLEGKQQSSASWLRGTNPWLNGDRYWVHRTKDIRRVRHKYSPWCCREENIGIQAYVRQGALRWL